MSSNTETGGRPRPVTAGPAGKRPIAIVVSEYHRVVTGGLEAGARDVLTEAGLPADTIHVFPVPGAFELAQAAQRLGESGAFSAVICLGCLIRGETPHFEYIAQAASQGIMRAAQATGIPMAFGVLTTNTAEEAFARSRPGPENKGREAAAAAVAMVGLYARLDQP